MASKRETEDCMVRIDSYSWNICITELAEDMYKSLYLLLIWAPSRSLWAHRQRLAGDATATATAASRQLQQLGKELGSQSRATRKDQVTPHVCFFTFERPQAFTFRKTLSVRNIRLLVVLLSTFIAWLPELCVASMASDGDMAKRPIRWGILGSGLISKDFVGALKGLDDAEVILLSPVQCFTALSCKSATPRDLHTQRGNFPQFYQMENSTAVARHSSSAHVRCLACALQVVSVGARSLESAQKFARELGVPKACGSYDDVICDDNVDVVYVGTVAHTHVSLAEAAIAAGKPVLVEKPLALNAADAAALVAKAKEANVFMMEGMWTRCFPAVAKVRPTRGELM
eukprot:5769005-Pleurochrysis_carterae.AAC.3